MGQWLWKKGPFPHWCCLSWTISFPLSRGFREDCMTSGGWQMGQEGWYNPRGPWQCFGSRSYMCGVCSGWKHFSEKRLSSWGNALRSLLSSNELTSSILLAHREINFFQGNMSRKIRLRKRCKCIKPTDMFTCPNKSLLINSWNSDFLMKSKWWRIIYLFYFTLDAIAKI